MNGLSPGLDRRRPAEWVDKADNPILCLSADKVIVGLSVLSKLTGYAIASYTNKAQPAKYL